MLFSINQLETFEFTSHQASNYFNYNQSNDKNKHYNNLKIVEKSVEHSLPSFYAEAQQINILKKNLLLSNIKLVNIRAIFYFLKRKNLLSLFSYNVFFKRLHSSNFCFNVGADYYKNNYNMGSFSLSNFFYLSLVLKVTLNNLFLTLINNKGEVLLSLSGGKMGLKGFQRRTTTALKLMLRELLKYLKRKRIENKLLFLIFKSNWLGLKNIILSDLYSSGVEINFVIFDIARCHNGLRKRKLRNR